MADDEKIEQVARRKGLLTVEQIESVNQAIREAEGRGEKLSFLEAAVQKHFLYTFQADQLREEAEKEIATSETEDISEAIPGQASSDTAECAPPGAETPAAAGAAAPAAAEGASTTSDAAGATAPEQPAATVPAPEATAGEPAGIEAKPAEGAPAGQALAEQTPGQPADEALTARQKPPYTAIAIGVAVLVILTILVGIFNR